MCTTTTPWYDTWEILKLDQGRTQKNEPDHKENDDNALESQGKYTRS